jgi:hypothetical protein
VNQVDQVKKALLVMVAAFLVIPVVYELLKIFMPLIFVFIGLAVMVKAILGKFSRW